MMLMRTSFIANLDLPYDLDRVLPIYPYELLHRIPQRNDWVAPSLLGP